MKIFGLLCLAIMLVLGFMTSVNLGYYLIAINCISAFITWRDKRAASKNLWRIQEQTLHGFALIGGWPAGIVAQEVFRHKTQKTPFKWIYRFMILLNFSIASLMAYIYFFAQ